MGATKLITTIVQDEDAGRLIKALIAKEFGATKIASTGGLLHRGSDIILVGVDEDKVPAVLEIVKETCQSRREVSAGVLASLPFLSADRAKTVEVGGAVVMVTDVERYLRV